MMARNGRFPDQLDPPLEYARMYLEVTGWVRDARDDDERQRLGEIANYYLLCAIESGNRESDGVRAELPEDLVKGLDVRSDFPLERELSLDEVELIRRCFAVPADAILEQVSSEEMHDLADMFEGWAQDAQLSPINVPRLLGMADSLRSVAKLAGPRWKPNPPRP